MLEAYRTKFDLLTRELQQKSSEIEKLLSELKEKDDKIKYITVNNSMALRFSDTYQDEIEKQKFMIEKQKKQIHQLEKEINDLLIGKTITDIRFIRGLGIVPARFEIEIRDN